MGAMQGAVWLPLIWLCVLELRGGLKRIWLAALALSLAMTVLAGLPQVAVAAFSSAVCLAFLLTLFRSARWRLPAMVSVACVWALLLAAVQILPTLELTRNSVAKYRAEWMGSGGGMPPAALISLAIPNYWNVFDVSKFRGPTDLTFLYLYSSLLGLLFAIAAMVWKPRRWDRLFTALLAIFTVAMLGDKTPAGRVILMALPARIRIGIHPEYLFCVFSLALAILAGLGAERVLRSAGLQIAAGIVIACDLILVSSGRPMNTSSTTLDPGIAQDSVNSHAPAHGRRDSAVSLRCPPGCVAGLVQFRSSDRDSDSQWMRPAGARASH
jgi:hypothetical protein